MVFSSIEFLVFFSIILLIMVFLKAPFVENNFSKDTLRKIRHGILLISSYIFYGWWDWRFCFLMLLMTAIAYYCSDKISENHYRKLFSAVGIIFPLITLGFFKYFNFFIDSFYSVFGIKNSISLNIILPVGISFYTFQSMSYTIDVLKNKIKSHSFTEVALYIAFFPQLVAGPIVKASDFMPQLKEDRDISWNNFLTGIQIFSFGLFKKIVISDNLSVFVDDVFSKPLIFSSASIILAVISYSIQIYCDFSGYSDMAIGAAKCLGYDFNKNFDMPYISKNVSEFWKRWHISLSTWLQEYLYIPLGGNRKGRIRTYINLMLTMILGGLWHGANVTFVVWGLLHGLALCMHKLFKSKIIKNRKPTFIGSVVSGVITYVFVCICWVFFRAETISDAFIVLSRIFLLHNGILQVFSWTVFSIIVILIAHFVAYIKSKAEGLKTVNGYYVIMDLNKLGSLIILFVFLGLTIGLAYTGSNPFIYFQF